MKKQRLTVIGVALVTFFSATIATEVSATTATPVIAPTGNTVATDAAAINSQIMDRREIRAQLMANQYTTLAAEIGAKINLLPIKEGEHFKEGTPLVLFDCSLQEAQLHKANAAFDAAEKVWSSNKKLAALKSVGKVELDVSEAEMQKAKADVEANTVVLSKCSINAPFSGYIAEQKVREQQFVQPGQPLLDILDDAPLTIEFIAPSKWMTWLKPDLPFTVSIDETAKTYPAKIQRIGARVDPVSQSVKITASIDGSFPELVAGMSGKILLSPPAKTNTP